MNTLTRAIHWILSRDIKSHSQTLGFQDITCRNIIDSFPNYLPLYFCCISLQNCNLENAQQIKKKIATYIESELENSYSINYWPKNSTQYKVLPLPDDLDDTVYALSALLSANEHIPEKSIVKLISLESQPGGPYKTWYYPKEHDKTGEWQDIDPIVNANLAQFVYSFGIKLPKLITYLQTCIRDKNISSPYYPYDLTFFYYLSKYCKVAKDITTAQQINKYLDKYDFASLSLLETIFYLIAKINIGEHEFVLANIDKVTQFQNSDGSYPVTPFCMHYAYSGQRTYAGNKCLTTSLVIELQSSISTDSQAPKPKKQNILETKVSTQKFVKTKNPLITQVLQTKEAQKMTKVIKVFEVLKTLSPKPLTPKQKIQIQNIATATYLSWMGYTLQDHIIDSQTKIQNIFVSNSLIREAHSHYQNALIEEFPKAYNLVQNAFETCDQNYIWEIENTRFEKKNIHDIAQKVADTKYIQKRMAPYFASIQAAATVLKLDQKTKKQLDIYFKSQILIDQLSDDAHDWEEDLDNGIMTYVLAQIVKEAKTRKKQRSVFWRKTILKIITISTQEYKSATKALEKIKGDTTFFAKFLEKSYSPIQKVSVEQKKAVSIIEGLKALG